MARTTNVTRYGELNARFLRTRIGREAKIEAFHRAPKSAFHQKRIINEWRIRYLSEGTTYRAGGSTWHHVSFQGLPENEQRTALTQIWDRSHERPITFMFLLRYPNGEYGYGIQTTIVGGVTDYSDLFSRFEAYQEDALNPALYGAGSFTVEGIEWKHERKSATTPKAKVYKNPNTPLSRIRRRNY